MYVQPVTQLAYKSPQLKWTLYLNRWELSTGLLHHGAQEKIRVNWTHDHVLRPASNKNHFIQVTLTKKQSQNKIDKKLQQQQLVYFGHIKISEQAAYVTKKTNNSQLTFFSPKFSESKSKFLQSSPTVNSDRSNVGLLNVQSGLAWRSICIFATTPTITYDIILCYFCTVGMLHKLLHLIIIPINVQLCSNGNWERRASIKKMYCLFPHETPDGSIKDDI